MSSSVSSSSVGKTEIISQYFSNIRDCLSSRDDASIVAALRLLCGLLSKGYDLNEFMPLVAQHVINNLVEVETLAQMLLLQVSAQEDNSRLQVVNVLVETAHKSPRESSRIRAIKTLSNLDHSELNDIISSCLQARMKDSSPHVQKATIIGAANFALKHNERKGLVKNMMKSAFDQNDPITISGAVIACDILKDTSLIIPYCDKLWSSMLLIDPWSQSRALHHLISVQEKANKTVLNTLLHSNNPSVVIEASSYFENEPEIPITPLIRLVYGNPAVSLHAATKLLKIAQNAPKSMAPFAAHFLPPQPSEQAEHISVQILGHIGTNCSPEYLTRWALNKSNTFAAHFIGQLKFVNSLKILLEMASEPIAEIAAFYAAEIADNSLLASLLEIEGPRSSVLSIFTDICKEHSELAESMLNIVADRFGKLSRDVKNEAALLSARLIDTNNSEIAKTCLERCLNDEDPDVLKRARILQMMLNSGNQKIKNAIWASKEPPPPSPPPVFIPVFE